jgi:hypothetical protein
MSDSELFWEAGSEHSRELLRRHWTAKIVTLRFVALVSLEKSRLFARLYTLCNNSQPETSGHADHRGHDARIIYSGLLDRYPDVKVSFRQAGGWVLYGVGRFSLRYHQREDARPMAEPPEAYLGRLYYDCLIHDSDSLQFLVNRVGADHVMLAASHIQHLQKALERMNVKLHDVISSVVGVSGLKVIRAILAGQRDAGELLKLCDTHVRIPMLGMMSLAT